MGLVSVFFLFSFFFKVARKEKQMDLPLKLWLISTAWRVFDHANICKKLELFLLEQPW